MTEIDPVEFLKPENLVNVLKGWKDIYDHLEKVCENHKGYDSDDPYTPITYESLTINIYGNITVNDTLTTLSMWEVSLSS